jgi:hypothetical protein
MDLDRRDLGAKLGFTGPETLQEHKSAFRKAGPPTRYSIAG